MNTAIATVCLSGGLSEKLEAIAAAGFRAIEIFENDLIAFPGSPTEVRRMCDDLGLAIVTFQPFRDFEGMPDLRRARTFDRAERKFDLMGELGCDLLLVCSSVSPEALGGIERLAADFAELGGRAAKRNIRVGYEALAWGRHIHDYRDAWEVVRRANHPNIGTILDTFHIQARDTDLGAIRAIPPDQIFLVQVADAPKLQMDYLSWSRHWRCMPGQGDFDLVAFMDALQTTNYDGYLSLEIFNDRFRAGSARAVPLPRPPPTLCPTPCSPSPASARLSRCAASARPARPPPARRPGEKATHPPRSSYTRIQNGCGLRLKGRPDRGRQGKRARRASPERPGLTVGGSHDARGAPALRLSRKDLTAG